MYAHSIRVTIGLVFVVLMLIGGLSVAVSLWAIQAQRYDALIINLAGRQRVLSQKTAQEAWLGLWKGQDPRYLAQMHTTAHQFEEGLRALMDGGQLTYAGTTVSVPPATDPAFRAALGEVQATFESLHQAAHAVLENGPGSPAFTQGVTDLERLSGVVLEEMDEAVRLHQAAAEGRVARLRWIQLAFLASGGLALALGYGLILVQVLRPVSALKMAIRRIEQGDLDYPVGVKVRNELGELAEAFEDMQRRVKKQTQELRLRSTALEAAADAIVIADRDGIIQWVNPAFTALTGYTPEEVIGQTMRLVKSGQHDRAFYQQLWETILSGQVWRGEVVNRRKDGSLYDSENIITPVCAAGGEITHFVAIERDITERKQMERKLREANLQLQEALSAKDEMIANVSHELRTPLTLISGYVQLLESTALGPLTAEQERAVQVMHRQGERLAFMINRLLMLQSIGSDVLRRVKLDLGLWLQQTVQPWEVRVAGTGIQLRLEVSSPLPPLQADPNLLGHVIENLLDNAVKFSPNGGMVQVRAWVERDQVIIAVSDQGIGIPPDKVERIFERFYQVDKGLSRRFSGMGIGLALCKAIVTVHGGRIWAESEGEGRGSTFYVALPFGPCQT
jgi:PAS domain S-box-containing protein